MPLIFTGILKIFLITKPISLLCGWLYTYPANFFLPIICLTFLLQHQHNLIKVCGSIDYFFKSFKFIQWIL